MKRPASLLLLLLCGASALVLNQENYAKLTENKTVFLKFLQPGCGGECHTLRPAWDRLMESFDGSQTYRLVADVECKRDECSYFGVKEFPTLKWGDRKELQDYEGGRTYEEFREFAENLKPPCSAEYTDMCNDERRALIEGLMAMSLEDLRSKAAEEEAKIAVAEEAEKKLSENIEWMRAEYARLEREKKEAEGAVKAAEEVLEGWVNRTEELEEEWDRLERERDEAIAAIEAEGLGMIWSLIEAKEPVEAKDVEAAEDKDEL